MSEWTSPYNPFNSMKALVHKDNFEGILEGKLRPPIVVNMDLTNKCNYNCGFCMFQNRERADPTGKEFRDNSSLPVGYAPTLPAIWKEWGVKAVCLAGGGEPTLHRDFLPFVEECLKNNLDLGIATNGYKLTEHTWDKLEGCKFVGFSMDAGNKEDYSKVKGVGPKNFQRVLNNMKGVSQFTEVGYKFLLDRDNWTGIYDAAKLAKKYGATHFQFRPAIDPDYEYFSDKIDNIQDQITRAQKDFETDNFKVMGVTHKFNPDFSKKHNFKICHANMLTTTWCADGNVYMCTDSRGNPWSRLGNHYPSPKEFIETWGSHDHIKKVSKIDMKNCDRCTLGPYNEMFEQVFIKDKMDKNLI